MTLNPYSPSTQTTASDLQRVTQFRTSRLVRVAIYAHLIAVALSGLGMTYDTRTIAWLERLVPLIELCLIFGSFAFIACPVLMLIGLARSTTTVSKQIAILGLEGAIICAHIIALIPAVQ